MAELKKKKTVEKKVRVAAKKKTVVKKAARRTSKKVLSKKESPLELKRSRKNPIIVPESGKYWESKAAFNPSAVIHDGKGHVIYRAIGSSDISVLGYASSEDGFSFKRNGKAIACT